jgi:hypothetical protein
MTTRHRSIHETRQASHILASTSDRAKVTATSIGTVVLAVLIASGPQAVMIPLAATLLTGLATLGAARAAVALVDRQMQRDDDPHAERAQTDDFFAQTLAG